MWKEAVTISSEYYPETTEEHDLKFLVKGPGFKQQLLNIKLGIDLYKG
jgi:hypothetical protein